MNSRSPILPAVLWLTVTTVLLCLPGSAIPQHHWFDVLMVDKWIHIFLFSGLTLLFSRTVPKRKFWMIALSVFAYGVIMEFIQKWFVVNRSFDVGDIVADAAGATVGYLISLKILETKRTDKAK